MRDPERIQETLELINRIWQRSPDLRFNQLMYSLQHDYSRNNGDIGQVKNTGADGFTRTGFDLFNLEDSAFIEHLRSVLANEEK
jgi:hypothetical protein